MHHTKIITNTATITNGVTCAAELIDLLSKRFDLVREKLGVDLEAIHNQVSEWPMSADAKHLHVSMMKGDAWSWLEVTAGHMAASALPFDLDMCIDLTIHAARASIKMKEES